MCTLKKQPYWECLSLHGIGWDIGALPLHPQNANCAVLNCKSNLTPGGVLAKPITPHALWAGCHSSVRASATLGRMILLNHKYFKSPQLEGFPKCRVVWCLKSTQNEVPWCTKSEINFQLGPNDCCSSAEEKSLPSHFATGTSLRCGGKEKGLSGLDRFPDLSLVGIVSSYFSLALPILLCKVIWVQHVLI